MGICQGFGNDEDFTGKVVIVDDSSSVFKDQVNLYFCIIESALEDLKVSGTNEPALGDLKLSADALYNLSTRQEPDVGVV